MSPNAQTAAARTAVVHGRALARVAGGASVGKLFTDRTEIMQKADAFAGSLKSFDNEVESEDAFKPVPGKYHYAWEGYPADKQKPYSAFTATWTSLDQDWWGDGTDANKGYYAELKVDCAKTFGVGCDGNDYTKVETFEVRLNQQIAAFKALGYTSTTITPPTPPGGSKNGVDDLIDTVKTVLIIAGIGVGIVFFFGYIFPVFAGAATATRRASSAYRRA